MVGTGRKKKNSAITGNIYCFGASTNPAFLDPYNGKHWIKKLIVDYKPSNQLEHKAEWKYTDTLER